MKRTQEQLESDANRALIQNLETLTLLITNCSNLQYIVKHAGPAILDGKRKSMTERD